MNQPFNEVKASSIAGVSLDCNLSTGAKIGGGTATDNTAALNAFLATASATNPIKLILDGPSAVSGLVIAAAGHTVIEGIGWDSGIWIISGSNADPLNNGKILPFDPNTTPPASGANVILRNFKINGNRGNGTTGDSNSGDPRGVSGTYWYCNINLANLNGARIEDMYIYDAPAYSIRLNNCSDVVVSNNTIINPNTATSANNDCIHVDGPAANIRVLGNYLNNNNSDDAIAFNAPEGYGGLIDQCVVVGNTFQSVSNAMRVYGASEGQVGSVVFSQNIGNVHNFVLLFGFTSSPATGDVSFRSVICEGNSFVATVGFIGLAGGMGDLVLTDCTWLSPVNASTFIAPLGTGTASSVTLNNCKIYRSTSGNAAATLLASSSAYTFTKMILNGFYIVNEQGQSYSAIAKLMTMANVTISQLFIASLDYTNIALLADSYTNITSLHGQGVFPSSQVSHQTTAYTVLPTDGLLTTTGTFSITLPTVAYAGERHTFKKLDTATTLTLVGTIDGSGANTLITQYSKLTVEFDGSAWWSV